MVKRKYEGISVSDRYAQRRRTNYVRKAKPKQINWSRNTQMTSTFTGLKKPIRPEKKGVDFTTDIGTIISTTNTNGDCFVLNLIQQGAGSWNRIGRKVNLSTIRLKGIITLRSTQTATTNDVLSNTVRMVLVWDKQPSGNAIPAFNTVFGRTDQTGTEGTIFLDPIRYDNMDRFSILKDCVYNLNPKFFSTGGTTNDTRVSYSYDEYIKLGNRECIFSGQSNPMTIADISSGALYVYFRTSNNTTANECSNLFSVARLRYYDA